ncbi:MAG TPA: hypothetical protein VJ717_00515, partial [Gemmatimonadaceae bacterium]|nr:hypothetical protein [Gemmatimonadaceae bacterium]
MPADSAPITNQTAAPLRLGLLVDTLAQPRWVLWALSRVFEQGLAVPALVIVNAAGSSPAERANQQGTLARLRAKRGSLAYGLYSRIDRWRFPVADDPLAREDLTPLIGDAPRLVVSPRSTTYSDYFPDEAVERILDAKLDLALRLGFRILRGRALGIARLGVWSYHHGDNRVNRGGPPGFWEVVEGH